MHTALHILHIVLCAVHAVRSKPGNGQNPGTDQPPVYVFYFFLNQINFFRKGQIQSSGSTAHV